MGGGCGHHRADLVLTRKAPIFEREGLEHLPPQLAQIQMGRVGWLEDEGPARVS